MKGKKYTIYFIITALFEEVALVIAVLWLLPKFNINISPWGLALMATGLGIYSYLTSKLSKEALDKKPVISPDIDSRGRTTTPLTPNGYVRVNNELWKASSVDSAIDTNEEVVVVGIEGMTLKIEPLERILLSNYEN